MEKRFAGSAIPAFWLSLLLGTVAFFIYWPSLQADFVYDARVEILQEGFITSPANLPAVLSLKVLGMNLVLGDRPGQMLYLMLIAAVCGKTPFGYHLCSNLLHAANVALLFLLLSRLAKSDQTVSASVEDPWRIQFAAAAATLVFALHPIAMESVAAINYSSDLLVAFFTLLALLAAITFRPENIRTALITGGVGVLCAFAAVTCKESGLAAAGLLVVYWFLYRRDDFARPWLVFLGSAIAVTGAFLIARFALAPPNLHLLRYLGGSLAQVFWIQPRLWVFMMGQIVWPFHLSADYTLNNLDGLSTPVALTILALVIALQFVLAFRSRLGALGVATYWLGLLTVSNFMPLNRILADRFYYLPLAGVAMQVLAVLLMFSASRPGLWGVALVFGATLPLAALTLHREKVFANEFALWSDTLQVSPQSATAHNGMGLAFAEKGQLAAAIAEYQKALEITPTFARAHNNLGVAYLRQDRLDEAMKEFHNSIAFDPSFAEANNNLGNAFMKKGQAARAIVEYRKASKINPTMAEAHLNLGNALLRAGRMDDAMVELQSALKNDSTFAEAHYNLGMILLQKGELDAAIVQYQQAVDLNPADAEVRNNFGVALMQKGQVAEGMTQFQKALEIDPANAEAQENVGNTWLQMGRFDQAVPAYEKTLKLAPDDAEAHNNLGRALLGMGRAADAVTQFQEALRLKPDDAAAQVGLRQAQAAAVTPAR
jgi:tetratricopeptide (TPR) repeat protein